MDQPPPAPERPPGPTLSAADEARAKARAEDERLVTRALSGEPAAFEALYERHQGKIWLPIRQRSLRFSRCLLFRRLVQAPAAALVLFRQLFKHTADFLVRRSRRPVEEALLLSNARCSPFFAARALEV